MLSFLESERERLNLFVVIDETDSNVSAVAFRRSFHCRCHRKRDYRMWQGGEFDVFGRVFRETNMVDGRISESA